MTGIGNLDGIFPPAITVQEEKGEVVMRTIDVKSLDEALEASPILALKPPFESPPCMLMPTKEVEQSPLPSECGR